MPILILVLAALFWGVFFGPFRRFFFATKGAVSRAARAPGTLICPECGSALKPGAAHAVSHHECPDCSGKWASHGSLTAGLALKKKPAPEWFEEGGKIRQACANCAAAMRTGVLRGQSFPVLKCAPCDAYWFGRIEWVSLELRVL